MARHSMMPSLGRGRRHRGHKIKGDAAKAKQRPGLGLGAGMGMGMGGGEGVGGGGGGGGGDGRGNGDGDAGDGGRGAAYGGIDGNTKLRNPTTDAQVKTEPTSQHARRKGKGKSKDDFTHSSTAGATPLITVPPLPSSLDEHAIAAALRAMLEPSFGMATTSDTAGVPAAVSTSSRVPASAPVPAPPPPTLPPALFGIATEHHASLTRQLDLVGALYTQLDASARRVAELEEEVCVRDARIAELEREQAAAAAAGAASARLAQGPAGSVSEAREAVGEERAIKRRKSKSKGDEVKLEQAES